jgi:large repetitive protein
VNYRIFLLCCLTMLAACSTKKPVESLVEDGDVTSINVTADKSETVSGGTVNLSATLEGTGNFSKSVTWKIRSGGGKIKGADTSAVYTADLAVDKGGPIEIEATARGNTSKTSKVTILVKATTSVVVNISSWDHASKVVYVNSLNIPVKLYDADKKLVQEGVTDIAGNISFLGLTPQEYTLTEDVPTGYGVLGFGVDGYTKVGGRRIASRRLPLTTGPTYLSTGFINTLAVIVGQVYLDKDFSGVREAKPAGATDVDRDIKGQINYSEPGVTGAKLTLTGTDVNGNPVNRITTADGSGRFEFPALLSGQYTLSEAQEAALGDWDETVVPNTERLIINGRSFYIEKTTQIPKTTSGSLVTFQHNGTDRSDTTTPFVIDEGQSVGGFMFAESDLPVTGLVYLDRDRDGYRYYPDERTLIEDLDFIPNVTLRISGNGQGASTISGKDGQFIFDRAVPAGTYTLTEDQPLGYGTGHTHVIGANHFSNLAIAGNSAVVVVPQFESSGVDPATLQPVKTPPPTASGGTTTKPIEVSDELSNIMGTVFEDDNGNGIRDPDGINVDPGLVLNVPMRLTGTDVAGNAVDKTVFLDKYGEFYFADLLQGTYKIEQTEQPQNYRDGTTRAGLIGTTRVGTGGTPNTISSVVVPAGVDAGGYKPVFLYDLSLWYKTFTTDGYTFGELANPPK